jgi:hypothetical protein
VRRRFIHHLVGVCSVLGRSPTSRRGRTSRRWSPCWSTRASRNSLKVGRWRAGTAPPDALSDLPERGQLPGPCSCGSELGSPTCWSAPPAFVSRTDGAVAPESRVPLARCPDAALSRVCSHNFRATATGSNLTALHHAASSPREWRKLWWVRHRGTANSSLTRRPSARGCANRRWWASVGRRPHSRQGCDATNSRCARSR